MFKAILPAKQRPFSTEFTILTPLGDHQVNGKENQPGSYFAPAPVVQPALKHAKPGINKKKKASVTRDGQVGSEDRDMNVAFDKLLDNLQIPSTLRPRLIGMDSTVKAEMLKSSQTMVPNPSTIAAAAPTSLPHTPRKGDLRRARSTESLTTSPRPLNSQEYDFPQPPTFHPDSPLRPSSPFGGIAKGTQRIPSGHARGSSFDVSKPFTTRNFSRSAVNLALGGGGDTVAGGRTKEKSVVKNITPTKFCSILTGTSSTQLDVEIVKKLILLLRNETASWTEEFLRVGGYMALLTRLNEILEVEWREEQHDDQVLHELLRCFKALSTSSGGCVALRSSCPTPYAQLVSLLYSDKKPGDVATRQLIVDLLVILFDLYPTSSLPCGTSRSRPRREIWESADDPPSSTLITLPLSHKTLFSLIQSLLLTPAPPPSEQPSVPLSPHEFIESIHIPRLYKTYLQELSDVCRDYFWVFCHPNNTIWILAETDEGKVEKPRAPGGMTGGVEFGAMTYFTTHLRFINAIATCAANSNLPNGHEHSAFKFHKDLFLSGLERIILISRKASTTYYPTLHLELSRYIALATSAGYELPWTISRLIGLPPSSMLKNGNGSRSASRASPAPNVHSKRGSGSATPNGPR